MNNNPLPPSVRSINISTETEPYWSIHSPYKGLRAITQKAEVDLINGDSFIIYRPAGIRTSVIRIVEAMEKEFREAQMEAKVLEQAATIQSQEKRIKELSPPAPTEDEDPYCED